MRCIEIELFLASLLIRQRWTVTWDVLKSYDSGKNYAEVKVEQ